MPRSPVNRPAPSPVDVRVSVVQGDARAALCLSVADWLRGAGREVGAASGAATADGVELVHACPECGADSHGRPLIRVPGARPGWVSASISRPADAHGPTPSRDAVIAWIPEVAPSPAHLLGLGIDVERLGTRLAPGVADVALADADAEAWRADGSESEALLREWVRREAALKALGRGLARDPRDLPRDVLDAVVDVDVRHDLVCAVAVSAPARGGHGRWRPRPQVVTTHGNA